MRAQLYPPVHDHGYAGHEDAEDAEEDPVLPDLGEGVLPDVGHTAGEGGVNGALRTTRHGNEITHRENTRHESIPQLQSSKTKNEYNS